MTKIDKIVKECLEKNVFDKDCIEEAKVILTWIFKGRKSAELLSPMIVNNLIENGFSSGDLLSFDIREPEIGLCFALMGAKGLIRQSSKGG